MTDFWDNFKAELGRQSYQGSEEQLRADLAESLVEAGVAQEKLPAALERAQEHVHTDAFGFSTFTDRPGSPGCLIGDEQVSPAAFIRSRFRHIHRDLFSSSGETIPESQAARRDPAGKPTLTKAIAEFKAGDQNAIARFEASKRGAAGIDHADR